MVTPRASKLRGPPPKVYNIFKSVIELSQLCCHNVRYFLNNPSVIFLQIHFFFYKSLISIFLRSCLFFPMLIMHFLLFLLCKVHLRCISREDGELGEASQVE
jgi:hypothetical protein